MCVRVRACVRARACVFLFARVCFHSQKLLTCLLPERLRCHRVLTDGKRLASQHAQTIHTTLSPAISIRHLRMFCFRWTLASKRTTLTVHECWLAHLLMKSKKSWFMTYYNFPPHMPPLSTTSQTDCQTDYGSAHGCIYWRLSNVHIWQTRP